MKDPERFAQLAGAMLAAEASPQERAELEGALATEPALAAEWRETLAFDLALRRALPTMVAPETVPAMPAAVRTRLEEARRTALAASTKVVPFAPAANDAPSTSRPEVAGRRQELFRPARFAFSWLALAACLAVLLGVAAFWWKRPRAASTDVIASAPAGGPTPSAGDQARETPPPVIASASPGPPAQLPKERTGDANPAVTSSTPLQVSVGPLGVALVRARLSQVVINTATGFLTKGAGEDRVVKRDYTKDAVIITRVSGARVERPYVLLPLRFNRDSEGAIDDEASRENIAGAARTLKDLAAAGGIFGVEVHAGAGDGDVAHGLELAKLRAGRVRALLVEQGVPADVVAREEGFAFDPARFQGSDGAGEARAQLNPRVLLVRIK